MPATTINFYNKFIPKMTEILPLYMLSKGSKSINLNLVQIDSFEKAKIALTKTTLINHPKSNAKNISRRAFLVFRCASDIAIGAVLGQVIHNIVYPLAFYSKILNPAQVNYRTFDRELVAVYLSIRHFRYF